MFPGKLFTQSISQSVSWNQRDTPSVMYPGFIRRPRPGDPAEVDHAPTRLPAATRIDPLNPEPTLELWSSASSWYLACFLSSASPLLSSQGGVSVLKPRRGVIRSDAGAFLRGPAAMWRRPVVVCGHTWGFSPALTKGTAFLFAGADLFICTRIMERAKRKRRAK